MIEIRVLLTGRDYDVASTIPDRLTLPDGCSLSEALQALLGHFPPQRRPSDRCLLAVSGKHLGTLGNHAPHTLRDGDELLLLAPVAGG